MAIHGSFPPSAACSALACMAGFPFMVLSINLLHVSKGVCSLDDLSAIVSFLAFSESWATGLSCDLPSFNGGDGNRTRLYTALDLTSKLMSRSQRLTYMLHIA